MMIEITIFTLEDDRHTPLFRAYPPETARRILDTKAAPPSHRVRVPASLDTEGALDAAYTAGNGAHRTIPACLAVCADAAVSSYYKYIA